MSAGQDGIPGTGSEGGEGENYGRIEESKEEDDGSIPMGDEGRETPDVNAMVPPGAPGEKSSSLLVFPGLARMRGNKENQGEAEELGITKKTEKRKTGKERGKWWWGGDGRVMNATKEGCLKGWWCCVRVS